MLFTDQNAKWIKVLDGWFWLYGKKKTIIYLLLIYQLRNALIWITFKKGSHSHVTQSIIYFLEKKKQQFSFYWFTFKRARDGAIHGMWHVVCMLLLKSTTVCVLLYFTSFQQSDASIWGKIFSICISVSLTCNFLVMPWFFHYPLTF